MKENRKILNSFEIFCRSLIPTALTASCLLVPFSCSAADFAGTLDSVTITDTQGINTPPTSSFIYTVEGDTVTFNANESVDSDGTITEYRWDFGDGATGTGVATSHTYVNTDNVSVTLTTFDNSGAVSLTQQTLATGDCSKTPFYDVGPTANSIIAHYDATSIHVGGLWASTSDTEVCQVDVKIHSWKGDVSAIDYIVKIYAVTGNDFTDYTSPIATSATVSGSTFANLTFSAFTFSTPFDISNPMAIVISRLDKSFDSSNRIAIASDSTEPGVVDVVWYSSTGTMTGTQSRAQGIKLYKME